MSAGSRWRARRWPSIAVMNDSCCRSARTETSWTACHRTSSRACLTGCELARLWVDRAAWGSVHHAGQTDVHAGYGAEHNAGQHAKWKPDRHAVCGQVRELPVPA
jgi:hypothetical protein